MPKERLGSFGDYEGETLDVDDWRELEDMIDRDIIIHEKVERDGKHGRYLLLRISTSEKPKEFFGVSTGALVIMKKVDRAVTDGNLPCEGRLVQPDGVDYFDILAPGGGK